MPSELLSMENQLDNISDNHFYGLGTSFVHVIAGDKPDKFETQTDKILLSFIFDVILKHVTT